MMISPRLGLPMIDARCNHNGGCNKKNDYRMVGSCANCKSKIVGMFTVGHDAFEGWNSPECPVCECKGHLYWKALEDALSPKVISTDSALTPEARAELIKEWGLAEEATP